MFFLFLLIALHINWLLFIYFGCRDGCDDGGGGDGSFLFQVSLLPFE
jgi:hypothetical protein